MPMPECLKGDRWTEKTARLSLPILVWCAKNGQTITYGQLNREIVRRGWGHSVFAAQYGYPAGAIGSALLETADEWDEPIPPLNALIVNQTTGIPGKGVDYYLSKFVAPDKRRRKLTFPDRVALSEEVANAVFNYRKWGKLLKQYGLSELSDGVPELMSGAEIELPPKTEPRGSGESEEHRRLKEHVAANPSLVANFGKFEKGKTEHLLYSADRVDILFENGHIQLGVEVKPASADAAELTRGIFQCVKYRALLRAEQKVLGALPNAVVLLVVAGKLSPQLELLAATLDVEFLEIPSF